MHILIICASLLFGGVAHAQTRPGGTAAPTQAAEQPKATTTTLPEFTRDPAVYVHDIKRRFPRAFSAYQSIVPSRLRQESWLHQLDGVSFPIVRFTHSGRSYVGGRACKPHDCQDYHVVLMAAEDGSHASAKLVIKDRPIRFFGKTFKEDGPVLDAISIR